MARLDYLISPHSSARGGASAAYIRRDAEPGELGLISSDSWLGTCLLRQDNVLSPRVSGDNVMICRAFLSIVLVFPLATYSYAQTSAVPTAASVWNALSSPAMDPAKSAHAENVELVRDRVHITLLDGTIQFVQPVNGVTFGQR